MLEPELLTQPLDFLRQFENQFEAGQIHVAPGTQVFDAANDADCLLIKAPTTAGGILDRRHQSMLAVKHYKPPRHLGQLCHHFDRVNSACIWLEELQRVHD